jgi:hypothetical protein
MNPASFLLGILHQMLIHLSLKVKGSGPTHLFSTTLIFGLESFNIFFPSAIVKENRGSLPFYEQALRSGFDVSMLWNILGNAPF